MTTGPFFSESIRSLVSTPLFFCIKKYWAFESYGIVFITPSSLREDQINFGSDTMWSAEIISRITRHALALWLPLNHQNHLSLLHSISRYLICCVSWTYMNVIRTVGEWWDNADLRNTNAPITYRDATACKRERLCHGTSLDIFYRTDSRDYRRTLTVLRPISTKAPRWLLTILFVYTHANKVVQ